MTWPAVDSCKTADLLSAWHHTEEFQSVRQAGPAKGTLGGDGSKPKPARNMGDPFWAANANAHLLASGEFRPLLRLYRPQENIMMELLPLPWTHLIQFWLAFFSCRWLCGNVVMCNTSQELLGFLFSLDPAMFLTPVAWKTATLPISHVLYTI